jgi:hypothetical protein
MMYKRSRTSEAIQETKVAQPRMLVNAVHLLLFEPQAQALLHNAGPPIGRHHASVRVQAQQFDLPMEFHGHAEIDVDGLGGGEPIGPD